MHEADLPTYFIFERIVCVELYRKSSWSLDEALFDLQTREIIWDM